MATVTVNQTKKRPKSALKLVQRMQTAAAANNLTLINKWLLRPPYQRLINRGYLTVS